MVLKVVDVFEGCLLWVGYWMLGEYEGIDFLLGSGLYGFGWCKLVDDVSFCEVSRSCYDLCCVDYVEVIYVVRIEFGGCEAVVELGFCDWYLSLE